MDDLGKDRGQILPCYRMGCAPPIQHPAIRYKLLPPACFRKREFLFFRNKNLAPVLALNPYRGA